MTRFTSPGGVLLSPFLRRVVRWDSALIDVVLPTLGFLATFLVHDTGYVLSAPYWIDEAWVAISTKLPLRDLPSVVQTSPMGWEFLLRLVPFGGDQRQRLVPLILAAVAVVLAYVYVRRLPWNRLLLARVGGVLAAVAALLVPSALIRNDLKQYTADAAAALVALLLVTRAEKRGRRRDIAWLAGSMGVLVLFSSATPIIALGAFGALAASFAIQRRWRDVLTTVVGGAAGGVLMAIVFVATYLKGLGGGLHAYWQDYYLPVSGGGSAIGQWFVDRGGAWVSDLGLGPVWLGSVLVLAGIATLILMRAYALALFLPTVLMVAVGFSAAGQYPLFDIRTSHYLAMVTVVTAAIGVTGLSQLLAQLWARRLPQVWARRHKLVVPISAAVAIALFTIGAAPDIRLHSIPSEDMRGPVEYLAQHRQPRDAVVVNYAGEYAYAYYLNGDDFVERHQAGVARWHLLFPGDPKLIIVKGRGGTYINMSLDEAAALAGPHGHIWFAYIHEMPPDLAALKKWAGQHDYRIRRINTMGLKVLTPHDKPNGG